MHGGIETFNRRASYGLLRLHRACLDPIGSVEALEQPYDGRMTERRLNFQQNANSCGMRKILIL
jgi:hypothetical protein